MYLLADCFCGWAGSSWNSDVGVNVERELEVSKCVCLKDEDSAGTGMWIGFVRLMRM